MSQVEEVAAPQPAAGAAERVAEALNALADEPAFAAHAGSLRDVARSLTTGHHASRWAEIDLHRAFDLSVVDVDCQPSRVVLFFERVRTGLFFAPVLLTWTGLYFAGSAYKSLLAADETAAREPFLKLWLSNFHGHAAFGLEQVSLCTVTLIVALMLCNVVLERQQSRDSARGATVAKALRTRAQAALTDASFLLVDYRANAPEQLRNQIAETARELEQVVDKTREITTMITASFDQLGTVAERLEAGVASSATTSANIASSSDVVASALAQVGASVEDALLAIWDANTATLADSTQALTEAVGAMQDGVTAALETSSGRTKDLAAAAAASSVAVQRLQQGAGQHLAALAGAVTSSMDELSVMLSTVKSGIDDGLDRISTAVGTSASELATHVESSSSWVVGAAEALLAQNDASLRQSEATYDRVGLALLDVQERLGTVLASNEQVAGLTSAHAAAVRKLAELDATLSSIRQTWDSVSEEFAQNVLRDKAWQTQQTRTQQKVLQAVEATAASLGESAGAWTAAMAQLNAASSREEESHGRENQARQQVLSAIERAAASLDHSTEAFTRELHQLREAHLAALGEPFVAAGAAASHHAGVSLQKTVPAQDRRGDRA